MIKKQTNFFINLMTQYFKIMESAAIKENYSVAVSKKGDIFDTLIELKDYLKSMGYVLNFEFAEKITTKEFNRLESVVNKLLENQSDPIKEFVNKLKSGGSISTPEDIQFYTNNKSAIESEMRKSNDY